MWPPKLIPRRAEPPSAVQASVSSQFTRRVWLGLPSGGRLALRGYSCANAIDTACHRNGQRGELFRLVSTPRADGKLKEGIKLKSGYNQPLVRAIRAASIRLAAPSLLIASDK